MFTWIISHQSKILSNESWIITVTCPFLSLPTLWQSIAHDGACMSVIKIDREKNTYSFFAMQESIDKTNFSTKNIWDLFNIELCMQASDRLDGHFVTGHIDTTWTITKRLVAKDNSLQLTIWFDSKRNPLLLPKGSIAVNGVSLTVVDVLKDSFTLWLIPLTQQDTNLWRLQIWESVNLEFDMLGKYVLKSQWISIQ